MEENEIFKKAQIIMANSLEHAKKTADKIKEDAFERINEFKEKTIVLREKNLPREEYLKELEKLVEQFNHEQNDDSAREEKIKDPEQFTGARNRFIIKAELKVHLSNYDDNWDSNTNHADGKYTTDKKNEWIAKKEKLEAELKLSPN